MEPGTRGAVNKHIVPVFIFLGIIALGLLFLERQMQASQYENDELATATVLPAPRSIHPFSLIDNQNKPFTEQTLQGHWTMMFFGYTECSSICPVILAALKKVYEDLENKDPKLLPQFVMVSIDPKNDTPQKLNRYVTSFNNSFKGATGSQKMLESMTREFGIVYTTVANGQNTIEHSGTILLFNPKGDLTAFFSFPSEASAIAGDFVAIRAHVG